MKKFLCILLVACLSLFAGCGQADTPEKTDATQVSEIAALTEPSSSQKEESQPNRQEEPTESTAQTEATEAAEPSEETEPTTQEEEVLEPMQQELFDSDALCAVAYLGVCEGNLIDVMAYFEQSGLSEILPCLTELTSDVFLEAAGTELYLVIPRQDVSLTVYEQSLDDESADLTWDKSLYVSFTPEPLLLRCNVSDIIPNIGLFMEQTGAEGVQYSPCLSLEDGSLCAHDRIYDLTPYELLLSDYDGPVVGDMDTRMGAWYTEAQNSEGETVLLELILDYDGSASYAYGYPGEEMLMAFYAGTWHENGEKMIFELSGGSFEAESVRNLYSEYEWDGADGKLLLKHVGGDALLSGLEGASLDMTPSHYAALVGLWSTSEYDSENGGSIYSDLELLADGSCNFLKHNGEGTTYRAYEGQWRFKDGVISIDMRIYSEFADAAGQSLSGEYYAAIGTEAWLTLKYISGDMLTDYMSLSGEEYFEPLFSVG